MNASTVVSILQIYKEIMMNLFNLKDQKMLYKGNIMLFRIWLSENDFLNHLLRL